MRRVMLFVAIGLTLLLILGPALAQANTCPELVRQALFSLGANCSTMERNSACYGFNRVNATFMDDVEEGFFSRPADRANLSLIERITTAPLDEALAYWGIAVLNVQANVPDTLPGQAVTVLLMGDSEIENAVEPIEPVAVPVTTAGSIYTGRNLSNNILTAVAVGTVLQADGVSEDGAWVRVQQPNGVGWIPTELLDPAVDLSGLPPVTADSETPMQAFYFRTSFNNITCTEAPSALAIRSPENIHVDLTVNGANIRLGSMVILRIIPPGNAMEIITVEGEAILEPDTPNQVVVPAGYSTQRCISEPEDLGNDGEANDQEVYDECQWLFPVLFTPEQQALARVLLSMYNSLEPTPVPSPVPTTVPAPSCVTGQVITHVVTPGQSLFGIAQIYNTTINAIMVASGLTRSNIFAGQRLTVTCGDRSNPPIVTPEPLPVDCARFFASATRLDDSANPFSFSWSAVSGATAYHLNISAPNRSLVFTTAGATELTPDLSSDPDDYPIVWNVEAWINDRVACSTGSATLTLDGPVVTPEPGTVDCSAFRATSPLDGIAFGTQTFYWDAAPGATSYVLTIGGETFTGAFDAGNNTNITIPTSENDIGYGFQFTWSVSALLNGEVACTSQATTIYRTSNPNPPHPTQRPDTTPEMSPQELECIQDGGTWVYDGEGGYYCDYGEFT